MTGRAQLTRNHRSVPNGCQNSRASWQLTRSSAVRSPVYKTAALLAELHRRETRCLAALLVAPSHADRPRSGQACPWLPRSGRGEGGPGDSAAHLTGQNRRCVTTGAGRPVRNKREGPSTHEMEGPARSRSPDAVSSRSASLPLDQPPSRIPAQGPGAPVPRASRVPPGWYPFAVVRDFYARGQGPRKGFVVGNFTLFHASTACPQITGSYPPQIRILRRKSTAETRGHCACPRLRNVSSQVPETPARASAGTTPDPQPGLPRHRPTCAPRWSSSATGERRAQARDRRLIAAVTSIPARPPSRMRSSATSSSP
jgi:hypothetical protein